MRKINASAVGGLVAGSLFFTLLCNNVSAQEAKKFLTRGDAILKISTTDFIKRKVSDFLSWSIGFDLSNVGRISLVPSITKIKATPRRVPPDGRSILELSAQV